MLTDRQIQNIRPTGKVQKVSDGAGLHLHVSQSGGKLWRMAYRFGGKQKLLSFGAFPGIGLAVARQKRDEAKAALARGDDPAALAKVAKAQSAAEAANTFRAIANEYLEKLEHEGKAAATLNKNRWFLRLADTDIGGRPVSQLSAADILVALRKVEARGTYESARRLRVFVGQVCRYAVATARAENDPTYGLKGALISPKVNHMAALTEWNGFASLLRAIWDYEGTPETRAALKLMALLYPRPGELRQARWDEFDLEKGVWIIPAARTKTRKEHAKPLPSLAVDILRDLQNITGNRDHAFPSIRNLERSISENTLNAALRRLGYTKDQATAHGFRASASTLLNESGLWDEDAIEAELAHVGSDEIRRAYHRAKYWDERVKMADWWSERIRQALV